MWHSDDLDLIQFLRMVRRLAVRPVRSLEYAEIGRKTVLAQKLVGFSATSDAKGSMSYWPPGISILDQPLCYVIEGIIACRFPAASGEAVGDVDRPELHYIPGLMQLLDEISIRPIIGVSHSSTLQKITDMLTVLEVDEPDLQTVVVGGEFRLSEMARGSTDSTLIEFIVELMHRRFGCLRSAD